VENFAEIGRQQIEKVRDRFDKLDPAARKKWFAYGGLLIVSLVLFLALGGSRPRPAMNIPAGDAEMLIGNTFKEMDERLVGMGEPDQPGIDWEKVPEGLDPVYETWGENPFSIRYGEKEEDIVVRQSDLSLSAISWRNGEAVVLINDAILKVGDFVDGAEVLAILTDSVILQRSDKRVILDLSGGG